MLWFGAKECFIDKVIEQQDGLDMCRGGIEDKPQTRFVDVEKKDMLKGNMTEEGAETKADDPLWRPLKEQLKEKGIF